MYTYEPTFFVEPIGYQPVEFLDMPPILEQIDTARGDDQRPRHPPDVCR